MLDLINFFGTKDPFQLMDRFYTSGNKNLLRLRNIITNPDKRKKPRTWGAGEAAQLINVTQPTLRKLLTKLPELPGVISINSKSKRFDLASINKLRELAGTRYIRPTNSEPMILAVSNFKGGVGKTQTAVDFSKKVAIEGLRVLLLDFDAQATATLISAGIIPDLELNYEDTITKTLLDDPKLIENIIIPTHYDGLDIIPANLAIQDAELLLQDIERNKNKAPILDRLSNALNLIKARYDVIVIDCGPNLGMLTLNAIMACNSILIPIPPSMSDYSSFVMYTATLRQLFSNFPNKQIEYIRILLTKHNGSSEAIKISSMMRAQFENYVLANHMCETVVVSKASSNIGTIYDLSSPGKSKEAYRRAMQHLNDLNMEIINNFKEIWSNQSQLCKAKENEDAKRKEKCS